MKNIYIGKIFYYFWENLFDRLSNLCYFANAVLYKSGKHGTLTGENMRSLWVIFWAFRSCLYCFRAFLL